MLILNFCFALEFFSLSIMHVCSFLPCVRIISHCRSHIVHMSRARFSYEKSWHSSFVVAHVCRKCCKMLQCLLAKTSSCVCFNLAHSRFLRRPFARPLPPTHTYAGTRHLPSEAYTLNNNRTKKNAKTKNERVTT